MRDTRNSPHAATSSPRRARLQANKVYHIGSACSAMATRNSQATTLDGPRAINKPPRAKAKGEIKGFHASKRSWYCPKRQDQRRGAVRTCVAHTKRPSLASSLVAEIKPGRRAGPTRETRNSKMHKTDKRCAAEGQENQEM
ncbi:hypothetical protein BP6252_09488 [Coleophoma cylindrospora]|uniref:Uncharacterized protein n=1 Tax=Coleophoma cylindrospora TaxID=1849047 RepID=A0A3D8R218_9HELO|nr:hypothetical protein BP6252_09488 [Coleophoma cylindrospora]